MSITPSVSQKEACDSVVDAIRRGANEAAIHGAAGCGKTTCVPYLIEQLDDDSQKQFVCTPTNKAAKVLRDKMGGTPVSTIHRIISAAPVDTTSEKRAKIAMELEALQSEKNFSHKKAKQLIAEHEKLKREGLKTETDSIRKSIFRFAETWDRPILHIDEGSMIEKTWRDAFRDAGVTCIYYGDPHQLPPIDGGEWFDKADNAFTLTENFRQKSGSQIIDAAMMVRESRDDDLAGIIRRLRSGDYSYKNSEVSIMQYSDTPGFYRDLANKSDQVIAFRSYPKMVNGKPSTKIQLPYLNSMIRSAKGINSYTPVANEPIVLTSAFQPNGLAEWYVGDTFMTTSDSKMLDMNDMPITWCPKLLDRRLPKGHRVYSKDGRSVVWDAGAFLLDLEHEDGDITSNVAINPSILNSEPIRAQAVVNEKRDDGNPAARCLEAAFGYTINGHQAQGSEYGRVSVFIEAGFLQWVDKQAIKEKRAPVARRWIYTALTRAKSHLNIIFPPNYS